jgi:hypothetical protein
MSGQSTGMQIESLVDALLSDERVLTASERALLANILQIVTSPTGSPQIDAQVASRVMTAIGTSVFQRGLGVLNQVFAQRLVAQSVASPQTNADPTTPVASSQTSQSSQNIANAGPSRSGLPPFVIPFFPLPPFIFNPQPPPLPPVLPPLDSPNPPLEVPGIIFPPFIFDPQPPPPTPPLPPDNPAPQYPPLPPDPIDPPNFVPLDPPPPPMPPTDTDTDTDTDTGIDTDTDFDGGDDGDGDGGCYVAGTPVHLGDRSLRSIEQLGAGDSILTVDARGGVKAARVLKRTTYTAPETVKITFTNGDSVEVTPRHRFVASGANLVRAKDLVKGDRVSTVSGSPAEVLKVASLQHPTEVHNLRLRQADRFFASKSGILGHVRKN